MLVLIDDRSLQAVGRFPFPRGVHARVIDRLAAAKARVIAYDVVFAERGPDPDQDDRLIRSIQRARTVVLAASETTDRGDPNVLGGDPGAFGATAGSTNLVLDSGGVVRRVTGAVEGLPSFAAAVAGRAGLASRDERLDGDGAPIDFAGPEGTYPSVSFSDVLDGTVRPSALRGRIVVVGASAPNLQDVHATATSDAMSGPEIEANAIATVADGLPLRAAPALVEGALIALLTAVAPLAVWRRRSVRAGLAATLAAGTAYALTAQIAFGTAGLQLPVASVLAALVAAAVLTLLVAYVAVAAERDLSAERFAHEMTTARLRAVEAADDARREVERNLHDGAQQQLLGIALELGTAREQARRDGRMEAQELDELLLRSRARVTDAVAELRALSRGTYPPALVEGGLDAGLEALVRPLPASVRVSGKVGSRLDPRLEAVAYFFVSEGLANALKHAGADSVEIEVACNGHDLRVVVRDDGRGGASPDGSGLQGLRERVESHGGTFEIGSGDGGGTTLAMHAPIR